MSFEALTRVGVGAALCLLPATSLAATVDAQLHLREGEPAPGTALRVHTIGSPRVESPNTIAFTGLLDDGEGSVEGFIFRDGEVIWRNSTEEDHALLGAEDAVGTMADGSFIYSPIVDGRDAIWTDEGLVMRGNEPAPGFAVPAMSTTHARPKLASNGDAYWVSGIDRDGTDGADATALYHYSLTDGGTPEPILQPGDTIGAYALRDNGVQFGYAISPNGNHRANILLLDTGNASNDQFVVINDVPFAQETGPTGTGASWSAFDLIAINNGGNVAVSGSTSANANNDAVLSYNGQIISQEGSDLADVALTAPASVRFVSLNGHRELAYAWGYGGGESVFVTCDATNVPDTTSEMLRVGDGVDLTGNGEPDSEVVNLRATAGDDGQALTDDGRLYLAVDLDDGDGEVYAALISIEYACCGNGLSQLAEACDDGNDDNTDDCTSSCYEAFCGDGYIHAGAEDCDDGNDDDTDDCTSTCAPAACGDGLTHFGIEDCDDGNDDDTDDCTSSCAAASCGDGFLHAGTEDCDDGNAIDGDGCSSSCAFEEAAETTGEGGSTGGVETTDGTRGGGDETGSTGGEASDTGDSADPSESDSDDSDGSDGDDSAGSDSDDSADSDEPNDDDEPSSDSDEPNDSDEPDDGSLTSNGSGGFVDDDQGSTGGGNSAASSSGGGGGCQVGGSGGPASIWGFLGLFGLIGRRARRRQ